MSIALAVLVSVAVAGCTTASVTSSPKPIASATSSKPVLDAQVRFVGYVWRVIAIGHAGKETPVSTHYSVYLGFEPDGHFDANDSVSYYGGTYHQTRGGFTTSGIYTAGVAVANPGPVRVLAMAAIWPFNNGAYARVRQTGNRIAVTIDGYVLTCQRDGSNFKYFP
jgi:hypothetical protein